MQFRNFALLLAIALVVASFSAVDFTIPAFLDVNNNATIVLGGFSMGSQSITAGAPASFITVISNAGNLIAEARADVRIYDAGNNLIGNFSYANATLAGGETQTLIKSWDTSGVPTGTYTAFVNVSYDGTSAGEGNITFTIAPRQAPSHVSVRKGEGNISLAVLPEAPEATLPAQPLEAGGLRLLRYPVFGEFVAGDNELFFSIIENPGDDVVQVSIIPSGPSAGLASPTFNYSLAPHQKSSVVVPIQIPEGTPPGFYFLPFELSVGNSTISYPSLIQVVSPAAEGELMVQRRISLDLEKNSSFIVLQLANTGTKALAHVQVYEEIPKSLAGNLNDVLFTTEPNRIWLEDSRVRWDLENILPGETRAIIYQLPSISHDLSEYSSWQLAQLVVIEPLGDKEILIQDMSIPSLMAGEQKRIAFKIFNAGAVDRTVDMDVLGPGNWLIAPNSFSVLVPARESREVSFAAGSPLSAVPAAYPITLSLRYGDTADQKTIFLVVSEPPVLVAPPPLGVQLFAWLGDNIQILLFFAIGLPLGAFAFHITYKRTQAPKYSEERMDYMKMVRRMFK
jgi:hypothetical protein